nr:hypothetical protein [uncultured Celeribacter sp.]
MVQELTRRADWRARLAAEMDRQRRTPFAWGPHDCALGLAAGAVEAITGADLRAGMSGRYQTARGALRVLRAEGFETLGDAVAALLPEHDNLLMARVGDIAVIAAEGPVREALAVVDVSALIVLTEQGHGRRPRAEMLRAFRVG